MRSADGASAPSASQTTPAATATQHSKHDQPRQITHHAPACQSPPVHGTPTTPSQDFRVLTVNAPPVMRGSRIPALSRWPANRNDVPDDVTQRRPPRYVMAH